MRHVTITTTTGQKVTVPARPIAGVKELVVTEAIGLTQPYAVTHAATGMLLATAPTVAAARWAGKRFAEILPLDKDPAELRAFVMQHGLQATVEAIRADAGNGVTPTKRPE